MGHAIYFWSGYHNLATFCETTNLNQYHVTARVGKTFVHCTNLDALKIVFKQVYIRSKRFTQIEFPRDGNPREPWTRVPGTRVPGTMYLWPVPGYPVLVFENQV